MKRIEFNAEGPAFGVNLHEWRHGSPEVQHYVVTEDELHSIAEQIVVKSGGKIDQSVTDYVQNIILKTRQVPSTATFTQSSPRVSEPVRVRNNASVPLETGTNKAFHR